MTQTEVPAPVPGYRTRASARIDEMPGASTEEVAAALVAELTSTQVEELAIAQMRELVEEVLRSRARRVETASARSLSASQPPPRRPMSDWVVEAIAAGNARDEERARLEAEQIQRNYIERRDAAIRDLTAALAEEIRLELTEELLSTEFAIGDGSRVTWGAATTADHERRIEMLEGNIAANADTAAKHRAAIEMLKTSHASTLRDIGVAA